MLLPTLRLYLWADMSTRKRIAGKADPQFIGATDSAAPCSFMLDLAEAMTPLLQARRDRLRNGTGILRDGFDEEDAGETTLQLLFLDGEEAFKDWTNTDSIYGARYVTPPFPPLLPQETCGRTGLPQLTRSAWRRADP